MSLNQDQQIALNKTMLFFAKKDAKDLIIDAPAGCGKGYLLHHIYHNREDLIARAQLLNDSLLPYMIFTATTNEAVNGLPEDGETIYSFAGIRPAGQNGFNTFKGVNQDKLIVFIDEASYINEKGYKVIRKQLPNAKIVWVMDKYQCAPVGSSEPYVDTIGCSEVNMAKVMRNQGAIQAASLALRNAVATKTNVCLSTFHNGNDIQVLSRADFNKKIVEVYKATPNPSNVRFLAYNVDRAAEYADAINRKVYGHPPFPYVGAYATVTKYNEKERIRAGTIVRVHSINAVPRTFSSGDIITEYFLNTSKGDLIYTPDKTPFGCWNENRYLYTHLSLPYGSTVHKSQGQSIDTVFIDAANINSGWDDEMKRRLRYVGLSRAIKQVYIVVD